MTRAASAAALLVKTLAVTFVTGARFCSSWCSSSSLYSVRDQVRAVGRSQPRIEPAAVRGARDPAAARAAAQAATLAENPTLKAALDTYHRRSGRRSDAAGRPATAHDHRRASSRRWRRASSPMPSCSSTCGRTTLAAAGPSGDRWPRGRRGCRSRPRRSATATTASRAWATTTFRVVTVPLLLDDAARSARCISRPASIQQLRRRARAACRARGSPSSATDCCWRRTLSPRRGAASSKRVAGDRPWRRRRRRRSNGESYAFRRARRRSATRASTRSARSTSRLRTAMQPRCAPGVHPDGLGAGLLALVGSFWLARLAEPTPIGQLSASLAHMAASTTSKGGCR